MLTYYLSSLELGRTPWCESMPGSNLALRHHSVLNQERMTRRERLVFFWLSLSTHLTSNLLTPLAVHAFGACHCASAVHWLLVTSPDFQPGLVTRGHAKLCVNTKLSSLSIRRRRLPDAGRAAG